MAGRQLAARKGRQSTAHRKRHIRHPRVLGKGYELVAFVMSSFACYFLVLTWPKKRTPPPDSHQRKKMHCNRYSLFFFTQVDHRSYAMDDGRPYLLYCNCDLSFRIKRSPLFDRIVHSGAVYMCIVRSLSTVFGSISLILRLRDRILTIPAIELNSPCRRSR
jgi:hypothetical protein